eukprot:CAMPEP_0119373616 /NCGR_PEP_ID=MMETSP1334-20130426/26372_1 /TAXON_ID=127549 /ORGANISM="Calcidiscus leptoporus, Strain RCC1130" /LENGTH=80 /DNA_ID=CAMNT_0007391445 /DNA_START=77 /DNA_END=317 /DNA_ORIENTATION=+
MITATFLGVASPAHLAQQQAEAAAAKAASLVAMSTAVVATDRFSRPPAPAGSCGGCAPLTKDTLPQVRFGLGRQTLPAEL